jgi:hypothetical protein
MAAVPAGVFLLFFLPLRHDSGNYMAKVKMIDYGGIMLNITGCLLILVALSGGGVSYAWNSPIVISLLTVGGVVWLAFILYEWKLAPVPIMPREQNDTKMSLCSWLTLKQFDYSKDLIMGICMPSRS